ESDIDVLLHHQAGAARIERRVEEWELLQRPHAGTHDKRERRELDARLRGLLFQLVTRGLEIGDVSILKLSDVGNVHPARVQTRTRDLLNAGQRLGFDRTP